VTLNNNPLFNGAELLSSHFREAVVTHFNPSLRKLIKLQKLVVEEILLLSLRDVPSRLQVQNSVKCRLTAESTICRRDTIPCPANHLFLEEVAWYEKEYRRRALTLPMKGWQSPQAYGVSTFG
jgi:hypothetical protein